ncbi:MAG: hypothetical protein U0892_21060 [Pirellulales bacterium]
MVRTPSPLLHHAGVHSGSNCARIFSWRAVGLRSLFSGYRSCSSAIGGVAPYRGLVVASCCIFLCGCSMLSDSSKIGATITDTATDALPIPAEGAGELRTQNPPARTIRFDGHEIVLGDAETSGMDTVQLVTLVESFTAQKRFRSAAYVIEGHRETAERMLSERWATGPSEAVVQFVAFVCSRRCSSRESDWTSLLQFAQQHPEPARRYQEIRNAFARELQSVDPSNERAGELQRASQEIGHPLVKIDCLRLLGLRELVAERNGWAESLCRQAVDCALASGNSQIGAELKLMVAESTMRGGQREQAEEAWQSAIQIHMAGRGESSPIDTAFWLTAEKTRPVTAAWPQALTSMFSRQCKQVGCAGELNPETCLWVGVGQSQYERGEMQSALLCFKRAETTALQANHPWLRIAQARCLVEMNQGAAAAALLSGPAAGSDPSASAAATCTLGSAKLKSGAYQQGAQLLTKGLASVSPEVEWPGKHRALADLALAQLIIGDTEPGLNVLHAAQTQFAAAGETLLLIQSLVNEKRLLEHEQRSAEATEVGRRVDELERI